MSERRAIIVVGESRPGAIVFFGDDVNEALQRYYTTHVNDPHVSPLVHVFKAVEVGKFAIKASTTIVGERQS